MQMKSSANAQLHRLKKLYELSMELSGDPMGIFVKVAKIIGETMDVKVVCLSEIRGRELYFLSVYVQGKIYTHAGGCPLAITPCATVKESKDIQVYQNVMELFPQAVFLRDHHAFSYCGFPSLDHDGKVVAVTCLLDDRPREFSNEDKELLRIFGQRVGLEIERKHMEERQRENAAKLELERNLLRKTLDGLFVYVVLMDANGKIIEANRSPLRFSGISREEFIGLQFGDTRAWAYDPQVRAKVKAAVVSAQRGETVRYDVPLMMAQGIVMVDFSLEPIFDELGHVTQIVACGVDVSERKRMEELLRQRQEELYYAQRLTAAGELTAIVSHELNQPLGAISNYVGGALLRFRSQLSANPELAEVLERVLKLSQRAITLIQGIRTLVRKQKSEPELISIEDVTKDVLMTLQNEIDNKQIKLSMDIPDALPPIWCQRIHLQQLLLNLILNAMQAMDIPSWAQRKLMIGARLVGGEKLEITVSDTGPGIAPEIAARLFEPFVSTKTEGIGLGLSICRTITEANGGSISTRPMDGPGTRFEVIMPINNAEENHG